MNAIKSIVAIVATVAATGAFAQEATPDTWITDSKSVASRREVHNQAVAARAAGTVPLRDAAMARVQAGETTLEEINRVTFVA